MIRILSTCARHGVALLVAASLAATPTAAPPAFAVAAPKFTDVCLEYRKPFTEIKNYQLNKILGGALKGILVAVATKALTDAATPDQYVRDANGNVVKKSKGSYLPWIIAGAAGGGIVGYVQSKAQVAENQEELRRAINSDFSRDVGQYSDMAQKLADLGNCRRAQIFDVQRALERDEIDAKTATKRLNNIEKWIKRDDAILSSASKQQTRAVGAYAQAMAMANGTAPAEAKNTEAVLNSYDTASREYAPRVEEDYVAGEEVITGKGGGGVPSAAAAAPPPAPKDIRYVVSRQGGNIRASTDRNAGLVKTLPLGTEVEVTGDSGNGWLAVTADGVSGHMRASLLGNGTASAVPPPAPAPSRKARPAPGKGVAVIKVNPPKRKAQNQRDQVNEAVGRNNAFNAVRAADRNATAEALRTARLAIAARGMGK